MISCLRRVDKSPQSSQELFSSTQTHHVNIENIRHVHVILPCWACWAVLECGKEKFEFFETLRKWSPGCVESIRGHKRAQNYFLQHRHAPRTSKISGQTLRKTLWDTIWYYKIAFHKIVSKISEKTFFQKVFFFSCTTHQDETFLLKYFLPYWSG